MRSIAAILLVIVSVVVVGVLAGYQRQPDPNGTFKRFLLREDRYTDTEIEMIAAYPRLPSMNDRLDFKPGPQVWVSPDYSKAVIFYFSQADGIFSDSTRWSCYQTQVLWDHEAEKR